MLELTLSYVFLGLSIVYLGFTLWLIAVDIRGYIEMRKRFP